MPRKKINAITEGGSSKEESKLERVAQESVENKAAMFNNKVNTNVETRASELKSRIIHELYKHYGARDSHANKHLYHHVMFEVARLSNKSIEEVIQRWPKFDIFTISEKIKEIVEKELEENPTIIYQMSINSKMIADMILAKAIYKSLF